jgi:hypothetical protein
MGETAAQVPTGHSLARRRLKASERTAVGTGTQLVAVRDVAVAADAAIAGTSAARSSDGSSEPVGAHGNRSANDDLPVQGATAVAGEADASAEVVVVGRWAASSVDSGKQRHLVHYKPAARVADPHSRTERQRLDMQNGPSSEACRLDPDLHGHRSHPVAREAGSRVSTPNLPVPALGEAPAEEGRNCTPSHPRLVFGGLQTRPPRNEITVVPGRK